eukprot:9478578-Pyramimonas_sp.AAC.1
MDAMMTIGSKHFAQAPECRPGYRTLAATIQPLLDQQRALRLQLSDDHFSDNADGALALLSVQWQLRCHTKWLRSARR